MNKAAEAKTLITAGKIMYSNHARREMTTDKVRRIRESMVEKALTEPSGIWQLQRFEEERIISGLPNWIKKNRFIVTSRIAWMEDNERVEDILVVAIEARPFQAKEHIEVVTTFWAHVTEQN
jgi:hypothetical protein